MTHTLTTETVKLWRNNAEITAGETAEHDPEHIAAKAILALTDELLANREVQPVAWTVGGIATHDKKWAERRSAEDNLLLEPLYRHPVITGIDENHYNPELEPGIYIAEIMTKGGAAVINGYYTAPPAPAVPPEKKLPELMMATYHEVIGWNACRAAMLAQPVRRGCSVVPIELTPEMQSAWDSAPNSNDDDTVNMMNAYRAMIAAAPEGGNEK